MELSQTWKTVLTVIGALCAAGAVGLRFFQYLPPMAVDIIKDVSLLGSSCITAVIAGVIRLPTASTPKGDKP